MKKPCAAVRRGTVAGLFTREIWKNFTCCTHRNLRRERQRRRRAGRRRTCGRKEQAASAGSATCIAAAHTAVTLPVSRRAKRAAHVCWLLLRSSELFSVYLLSLPLYERPRAARWAPRDHASLFHSSAAAFCYWQRGSCFASPLRLFCCLRLTYLHHLRYLPLPTFAYLISLPALPTVWSLFRGMTASVHILLMGSRSSSCHTLFYAEPRLDLLPLPCLEGGERREEEEGEEGGGREEGGGGEGGHNNLCYRICQTASPHHFSRHSATRPPWQHPAVPVCDRTSRSPRGRRDSLMDMA